MYPSLHTCNSTIYYDMSGCDTHAVNGFHICPWGHQSLDNLKVPLHTCVEQGCPSQLHIIRKGWSSTIMSAWEVGQGQWGTWSYKMNATQVCSMLACNRLGSTKPSYQTSYRMCLPMITSHAAPWCCIYAFTRKACNASSTNNLREAQPNKPTYLSPPNYPLRLKANVDQNIATLS